MFHDDKTPSLSIIKFPDGHWRFKCFACGASGDPIHYIQRTEGMSFVDAVKYLAAEAATAPVVGTGTGTAAGVLPKVTAQYDYFDGNGVLQYQVLRIEPKSFRQRRPDPQQPGAWHWDMCGVTRVLYRLPDLIKMEPGSTVYYVEGEKDVHTLLALGLAATTHAGGAGSFRDDLLQPIKHLRVVVVPDNDDPGKQLMRRVWAAANKHGMQVGFLMLPPQFKDSSDYFAAGGTVEEYQGMVK